MYYLQSRYYDSGIKRFISADDTDYLGISGTVFSYNPFAYCEDDPVNYSDPSGYYTVSTTGAAKTSNGFSVSFKPEFLNKDYCLKYAEKIINKWGSNGKYKKMNKKRIAMELFAHAYLYLYSQIFYYGCTAKSLASKYQNITYIDATKINKFIKKIWFICI